MLLTEISDLYRDFPETRSRCWHTESIYWNPAYMGHLKPFRAISAEKPDLSNFLVNLEKNICITHRSLELDLLVFWRSNKGKTFSTSNIYDSYLIFRIKIMFQHCQSKFFKIHLLTPLKPISVKIIDFHVFWAKS